MTCIVGFVDAKKNIYLGGDSAGVSGFDVTIRKDLKVFKKDKMVIGYTSSFRMGQLLRFKLKIPKQLKHIKDYEYMCSSFIDAVRKCLKDNGYAEVKNNEERIGEFIVGYKGNLYKISGDLQVGISAENYTVCGWGSPYALGSLATNKDFNPIRKIYEALQVAEKFSGGVRHPFKIITLNKEE